MSGPDAAHPPAASGAGSKLGQVWGYTILAILVIMSNVIGAFSGQLNSFLSVIKFNAGVFGAIAVAYLIAQAMKK